MKERNELAAAVYAGPNVCPTVHGVAYCLADGPWWRSLEPPERKRWLSPLARQVVGTRADARTALARAWLAVDMAAMFLVPTVLFRLAAALEYRGCEGFPDVLHRHATALQGLYHDDGSRPLDTYLRELVQEAAGAVSTICSRVCPGSHSNISQASLAAHETTTATLAAARSASQPMADHADLDGSLALSMGIDVGTAGLAAVRAVVAAGSDVFSVSGTKPAGVARPAMSIRSGRDLVRDRMIGLVEAMCALKPERPGLNGHARNGKR